MICDWPGPSTGGTTPLPLGNSRTSAELAVEKLGRTNAALVFADVTLQRGECAAFLFRFLMRQWRLPLA